MRCNKAQGYLSQAMDEQLPPATTRELDQHLDGCADCRQYQSDLLRGRRILAATSPSLGEDFDWRLRSRLNDALRKMAGETAYPWDEEPRSRRNWVGPFTTAASLGLAAVLALAMFLGPDFQQLGAGAARPGHALTREPVRSLASDRLPLTRPAEQSPFRFGSGVTRTVSRSGGLSDDIGERGFSLEPGWTGNHLQDLRTIQELRLRNQRLTNRLYQIQQQNTLLRAHLDRADSNGLNQQGE